MGCESSKSVEVVDASTRRNSLNKTTTPQLRKQSRLSNLSAKRQAENDDSPDENNSSTVKYRLNYFDLDGRGEIIRLILIASGAEFEDNRLSFSEWSEVKENMPLGQLPVLDIKYDPVPLVQSMAIARFCAKENGLAGETSLDMAKIDAVVDSCHELYNVFSEKVYRPLKEDYSDESRQEIVESFCKNDLENRLKELQTLKKQFGCEYHFVAHQLTWADLYVYQVVSVIKEVKADLLDNYPEIEATCNEVENHPKLSEYLTKRINYFRRELEEHRMKIQEKNDPKAD